MPPLQVNLPANLQVVPPDQKAPARPFDNIQALDKIADMAHEYKDCQAQVRRLIKTQQAKPVEIKQ